MYEDLYIYWINRALTEDEERLLGQSFIGNWVEDNLSFLFFTKDAQKTITRLRKKDHNLKILEQYHMTYEQWQGRFYEYIQVDRFIIIPPWHKKEIHINGDLIPIFLDPGVVFGNGLHPSTKHCISAISWLLEGYQIRKVLDLGTGTGILAIVAAKLGAEKVISVDINPLCVKTANRNVIQNGLENIVEIKCVKAEDIICQYKDIDLVIANLSYDVISNLIDLSNFLDKNIAILSGMLRSQWANVKIHLIKKGCEILREWDHEMTWYTAMVVKGGVNKK